MTKDFSPEESGQNGKKEDEEDKQAENELILENRYHLEGGDWTQGLVEKEAKKNQTEGQKPEADGG